MTLGLGTLVQRFGDPKDWKKRFQGTLPMNGPREERELTEKRQIGPMGGGVGKRGE